MRDKEFDQFLRKKLAEFKTPESKNPIWTRLEESLKEDKKFDNNIRQKLRGIHTGSKFATWEYFENKRRLAHKRKMQIIYARTIESVLLMMLIWTANRILVPAVLHKTDFGQRITVKRIQKTADDYKFVKTLLTGQSEIITLNQSLRPQLAYQSIYNKDHKNSQKLKENNPQDISPNQVPVTQYEKFNNALSHYHALSRNHAMVIPNQKEESSTIASEKIIERRSSFGLVDRNQTTAPNIGDEKDLRLEDHPQKMELIQILPSIIQGELASQRKEPIVEQSTPPGLRIADRRGKHKVVAPVQFSVSQGVRFIRTSSVALHAEEFQSPRVETAPYSEFGLSFVNGNFHLRTGVGYCHFKSYPEIHLLYTSDDYVHKLSYLKSEFHLVNIPIAIERYWKLSDGLDVFGGAGMDLNIAVNNSFEEKDTILRKSGILPLSNIPDQSKVSEKAFNLGIAAGEDISNNAFVTIGFNLGVEYKLNQRLNLNFQAQYKHMVNPQAFGPHQDRYQMVNLMLGLNYNLRRR
ncbi:MAG TPA: hypothetical protein PKD32_01910 [Saprospiraceae bacterium]|nr:hypothetical protein [Saprospiraceae bacterium]